MIRVILKEKGRLPIDFRAAYWNFTDNYTLEIVDGNSLVVAEFEREVVESVCYFSDIPDIPDASTVSFKLDGFWSGVAPETSSYGASAGSSG